MLTIQYNIMQCTAFRTCAGDGINTRTMVFHNGSCTSLNCQDASNLEDYIFGRCPPAKRPRELYAYDLLTIRHVSKTSRCHMTFRQCSAPSAKVFQEADTKISVLGYDAKQFARGGANILEASCSSEMLVHTYQIIRHYTPDDSNVRGHLHKNLKHNTDFSAYII
jgi:hypothetical protein